jgi:hypothetical protein
MLNEREGNPLLSLHTVIAALDAFVIRLVCAFKEH